MISLFELLALWFLALAGAVDPCDVPELADTPECQDQTPHRTPGVDPLTTNNTEISNGF